eukprot:gene35788-44133_t
MSAEESSAQMNLSAELTQPHCGDTPFSPTSLVEKAIQSLPTEDNAANMMMIDSEKVEVSAASPAVVKAEDAVSVKEENIEDTSTAPVESIPKQLFSSPAQTTSKHTGIASPSITSTSRSSPSPAASSNKPVYQFNESKEEVTSHSSPVKPIEDACAPSEVEAEVESSLQSLRLDDVSTKSSDLPVVEEALLSPTSSELRHLPALNPAGPAAVRPVLPVRDAFDDIIDVLLRLVGIAI